MFGSSVKFEENITQNLSKVTINNVTSNITKNTSSLLNEERWNSA